MKNYVQVSFSSQKSLLLVSFESKNGLLIKSPLVDFLGSPKIVRTLHIVKMEYTWKPLETPLIHPRNTLETPLTL